MPAQIADDSCTTCPSMVLCRAAYYFLLSTTVTYALKIGNHWNYLELYCFFFLQWFHFIFFFLNRDGEQRLVAPFTNRNNIHLSMDFKCQRQFRNYCVSLRSIPVSIGSNCNAMINDPIFIKSTCGKCCALYKQLAICSMSRCTFPGKRASLCSHSLSRSGAYDQAQTIRHKLHIWTN